jgi:hypothetical protein
MSYVVRVWERPIEWQVPVGFEQALAELDRLEGRPDTPSAKMTLLGQRLHKLFPQSNSASESATWTDGPIDQDASGPIWNIGIATRDRLDLVQAALVVEATAMGLNVLDEQAGELHLGNGSVRSVSGGERIACVRGLAAIARNDLPTAREEFRRLTAAGNGYAQTQWAQMFLTGQGERHDLAIGCALVCAKLGWSVDAEGRAVAPIDPASRKSGEALRRVVGPQAVIHADRMLRRSRTPQSLVQQIDDFQRFFREVEPDVKRALQAQLAERAGARSGGNAHASPSRRRPAPGPVAPAARERVSFELGHVALLVSVAFGLWIFTFPESRRLVLFLFAMSSATGAFGVLRIGSLLEWSTLHRLLLVAAALLPPTTLFASLGTLFAAWRAARR